MIYLYTYLQKYAHRAERARALSTTPTKPMQPTRPMKPTMPTTPSLLCRRFCSNAAFQQGFPTDFPTDLTRLSAETVQLVSLLMMMLSPPIPVLVAIC